MDIFSVISLLGGLAFFLYGMSLMGSGLKMSAGGRLESILEQLTSTPLKGVLLGTIVTAAIQSSSATTVMVVGFVNSGMMRLTNAIGIIMGANIGTTVTGWILSLSGISGETFWLRILQPSTFSPLVALVGVVIFMFTKNEKKKHIGTILIGFAVLMYGMEIMSDSMSTLESNAAFRSLMVAFNNPLLGILVGIVVTALLQSSSASIGILQAFAKTGSIPFSAVVPLTLGMNIGACSPVLLSAIGANRNAKRAAFVYLYFNMIGTAIFLVLYYTLHAIFHFSIMDQLADPVSIAIFNTVFKLGTTLLLLPFTKLLEKLTYLTIREPAAVLPNGSADASNGAVELLDERFLNFPSYALSQCKSIVNRMADIDLQSIRQSLALTREYREDICEQILHSEDLVDEFEDHLGTYLIKLGTHNLSPSESLDVSKLLHTIGDFERIGDHSVNICKAAQEIHDKKIHFSRDAGRELAVMEDAVREIMQQSVEAFHQNDILLAARVEPLDEVIGMMQIRLKDHHIHRLREGTCTIETGFVFNDLLSNYQRIADHCSNIAVCVLQMKDERLDAHSYLRRLKETDNTMYTSLFEEYKLKYLTRLDEIIRKEPPFSGEKPTAE